MTDVTKAPDVLYAERERRFDEIVALRKPDRIPVAKEAVLEFGWDQAVPSGVLPSEAFGAVALKQLRWPGGDLLDDAPFQFVENEWLAEDEYDAFPADPNGFTATRLLLRMTGGLAGLGQVHVPPLYWFSSRRGPAGERPRDA
jgi:hypothetical protein